MLEDFKKDTNTLDTDTVSSPDVTESEIKTTTVPTTEKNDAADSVNQKQIRKNTLSALHVPALAFVIMAFVSIACSIPVYFMTKNVFLTIEMLLFSGVLTYAAYVDFKTHYVHSWTYPAIMAISVLGMYANNFLPSTLISMAIGLVVIPLPLIWSLIKSIRTKKGGIGGGDILLMAACGFLLGWTRGFISLFIGLLLFVIIEGILILTKHKDKKDPSALIPYLAIGCIIAFYL